MKVLVKADEVIQALASEGPLSPADLAEQLNVPRSSVYRLLDGLSNIGLTTLVQDASTSLSLEWLYLADRARESLVEWRNAREALERLVHRTGQTAFLSVLRGDEAVCVDWAQGRAIGVLILKPGGRLPLHAGAAGRTLLAFAADTDAYLSSSQLKRFTTKTKVLATELRDDIAQTRQRGYALSEGDVTQGISAIGAPIQVSGETVGAISLAGLSANITLNLDWYVESLLMAADSLASAYPAKS